MWLEKVLIHSSSGGIIPTAFNSTESLFHLVQNTNNAVTVAGASHRGWWRPAGNGFWICIKEKSVAIPMLVNFMNMFSRLENKRTLSKFRF